MAIERCQGSGLRRRLADLVAARAPRPVGERCQLTEPWPDHWVGPHLRLDLDAAGGERGLRILGTAAPAYLGAPLRLLARVDGLAAGNTSIDGDGPFVGEMTLPAGLAPGRCRVEIEAVPSFVPDTILGNGDRRRLCWLIQTVDLRS
jgi:hypothetical protein